MSYVNNYMNRNKVYNKNDRQQHNYRNNGEHSRNLADSLYKRDLCMKDLKDISEDTEKILESVSKNNKVKLGLNQIRKLYEMCNKSINTYERNGNKDIFVFLKAKVAYQARVADKNYLKNYIEFIDYILSNNSSGNNEDLSKRIEKFKLFIDSTVSYAKYYEIKKK